MLTIGNFDGVHLGHRSIVDRMQAHKEKIDGETVILTFKPHPQMALRPEKELELLNTYEEKLEILQSIGVDAVIEQPFSREFSNLSAEDFVTEVLQKRLRAKVVLLGYDFAFGKGRTGDTNLVRSSLEPEGVIVEELKPFELLGEPVSSSRIRHNLHKGQVKAANECLGREFFLRGMVAHGEGRGKRLGFPTANIQCKARLVPLQGVYATRIHLEDSVHDCVTNIGHRPTFAGQTAAEATIEAHLYDYTGDDFYGQFVTLDFHEYVRGEQSFEGPDELSAQIQKDIDIARDLFSS